MSDAETLADLIRTHRHDRTWAELEAASKGPESSCAHASWSTFANERRPLQRSPERGTIKGIAKALGVSDERVWAAIGASLGITPDEDSPLMRFLSTQPTRLLSGRAVALIVQLVDELTNVALTTQDTKGAPVRAINAAPSKRAARKTTGNEDR